MVEKSPICSSRLQVSWFIEIPGLTLNYIHFGITFDPCNLIASHLCNLHSNCTHLCSKSHLFPGQWDSFTKTQQSVKFQGFSLQKSIKLQENETQLLQLFSNKINTMDQWNIKWSDKKKLIEPMNLWFQNRCNKEVLSNWTLCCVVLVWNHIWN